MQRFQDRHVLIFGGNSGIGLSAARGFAAEGARLTITGRSPETLAAAAEETGALALCADIAAPEQSRDAVAAAVARHGPIDVLFVNAGVGGFSPIAEVTEAFWDDVHGVNLRGAFFAAQAALPHMRARGAIVFTGSIGSVAAIPGNAAYAAAKAGLRAVARIFAVELMPRSIRVNVVSPGPTETPLFRRNPGMTDADVEAMRAQMRAATPMGRIGEPEEVARAVLFLASDEASFITGIDLYVDGGCIEL
ncbi:MAG: SDR family oxidoreductase [Hydrogenophilaceae bacterium]|jgi:NAD(P)-dependent dehydrogenase (short-subunit alcohol dehydrogenase family)|nr:SDR family oxidoreductase [Hydrogenophilaceae bacterium]